MGTNREPNAPVYNTCFLNVNKADMFELENSGVLPRGFN
jgi:hypothetical protein